MIAFEYLLVAALVAAGVLGGLSEVRDGFRADAQAFAAQQRQALRAAATPTLPKAAPAPPVEPREADVWDYSFAQLTP